MKITPSIPRKPNRVRARRLQKDDRTVVGGVAEEDRIKIRDAVGTDVESTPLS